MIQIKYFLPVVVFVIVFAGIGAHLLDRSHAATICDLNATTSTFASQFAAAQSGQTLCLASGSYGTFTGSAKSGRVTIEPAQGAAVDMTANFNGASNITVTGMTLDNATLQGATHDVTLSYSTVPSTGQIVVDADQMNSASNILIDHNTLSNQMCTSLGVAGRIHVRTTGASLPNTPVGIIISNNYLSGGNADGVRVDDGVAAVQILNNTFTQFNDADPCHADTIQFVGGSHVTIKGNFFYNQVNVASCSLGMWNGGDHNVFEDNVVAGIPNNGCYDGVDFYTDSSSTVTHNVFSFGYCLPNYSQYNECGVVGLAGGGSGTLVRDNILTSFGINGSTFSEDHNLCHDSGCNGTGDITGTPIFVGGSTPTTFAGFALAQGSSGIGAASDGTNMGIELPTGGGSGTPVTGDLDNNGHVNVFDLSILLSHWGQTGSGITGDINNDGIVNIFDLSVLLSHYGT